MSGTAAVALERLRRDRALRSIGANRARLATIGARLESAARAALTQDLVARIRTDRRFTPALQGLVRLSLTG